MEVVWAAADLATSHRHRSSFLQRLGRFLLLAGQAGLLPPAARPEDREAPPPPRRTQRWRRQHTHHRVGAPLCLTEALLDVVEGAGAWARGRRWRSTLAERTTHCCRADASVAPRTQRSLTRWEKAADSFYTGSPSLSSPTRATIRRGPRRRAMNACRFCGSSHASKTKLFNHLRESYACAAAAVAENPDAATSLCRAMWRAHRSRPEPPTWLVGRGWLEPG